ncbi:MAG: hypothetical protein ISR76_03670 [Planctomycetes bacterium]|nr:hypothetical protein [Planctomycetota bacterium]
MPVPADHAPESILALRREQMTARVRLWQQRSGMAPGWEPGDVLEASLGALWIELVRGRSWRQALRRALYLDWERPRRTAHRPLPAGLGRAAAATAPPPELPPWTAAWLIELSAHPGGGAKAARELGWTRQRTRLVLGTLARQLGGPGFWTDLERRCARLHARAASEAPSCAEVQAEARALLRLMSHLELPAELEDARRGLSTLAARRAADPLGSPAASSA